MDFRSQMSEWLVTALLKMGFVNARVEWEDSVVKGLIFNLIVQDPDMLIGRQGSTLLAFESLARATSSKFNPSGFRFTLDIDDYKRKREWRIKEIVRDAIAQTSRTGKPVFLTPMSSSERKFVHAFVSKDFPQVVTKSVGEDPYRKIALENKK